MIKNIEDFIPYRNEFIELVTIVAQYSPTLEYMQKIHRLFENLIPYMNRPPNISQSREWDFDNFKFLAHELFLYVLAIFLKQDQLDGANYFLTQKYYVPGNSDYDQDVMTSFVVFRARMTSLSYRNERLKLRSLSVRADLLKERSNGTGIEFRHLMQADFIAFMRAEIETKANWREWWPETLLYVGRFSSAFEIFARSVSKAYFDRVKVLLGIENPKELEPLFNIYKANPDRLLRWEFNSFNPTVLLGYDKLATQP